jgi:hypothetical protein
MDEDNIDVEIEELMETKRKNMSTNSIMNCINKVNITFNTQSETGNYDDVSPNIK